MLGMGMGMGMGMAEQNKWYREWDWEWLHANGREWDSKKHSRSPLVGNEVTNDFAKFHNCPLRIKKALGIFRKVVTRRTTVVATWDSSRVKKTNLTSLILTHLATAGASHSALLTLCAL